MLQTADAPSPAAHPNGPRCPAGFLGYRAHLHPHWYRPLCLLKQHQRTGSRLHWRGRVQSVLRLCQELAVEHHKAVSLHRLIQFGSAN